MEEDSLEQVKITCEEFNFGETLHSSAYLQLREDFSSHMALSSLPFILEC